MKYNRKTLFAELRKKLFHSLSSKQVDGIEILITEGEKREVELDTLAYILATVYHETAYTMQPIKEIGSDKYLKSKKYWPYVGRGYVQLTWKKNYQKVSSKYNIDAVTDPDLVMEQPYATEILFDGMNEGWFSGKSVGDYIDNVDESDTEDTREYVNARKIINGSDKAKEIAVLAMEWRRALNAAWITNSNPIHKSTTVVAGGVAAAAGADVLAGPVTDLATTVNDQKSAFDSGSILMAIIGLIIVGASAYVVWARWDAAGRPKFW